MIDKSRLSIRPFDRLFILSLLGKVVCSLWFSWQISVEMKKRFKIPRA